MRFATLEEAVRFGLAQEPPLLVREIIVQDEYTHDVVMPDGKGRFWVLDTT
jgi:hypothetical protein